MKKVVMILTFLALKSAAMEDRISILALLKKACQQGEEEQIKALLPKVGNDWVDEEGRTPLFYVVSGNCIEETQLMIKDYHMEVNVTDKNGATPLHFAAWWSSAKIVRQLLDAGAKVNVKNNDGDTPLLHAVKLYRGPGNPVIEELMAANADIHAENKNEYSPYKAALNNEYKVQLLALLKSKL